LGLACQGAAGERSSGLESGVAVRAQVARLGDRDPGATFDRLLVDGHVQLWGSDAEALANVALTVVDRHVTGQTQAVSVATNDEAGLINEAVHQQLAERGLIDTTVSVSGVDGLEIGAGDRVMTRGNSTQYGVANRQV